MVPEPQLAGFVADKADHERVLPRPAMPNALSHWVLLMSKFHGVIRSSISCISGLRRDR